MNYLTVDLYKDFECVADACPNTCCGGWRIEIDEKTYQKMVDNQERLGVPAEEWISQEDDAYLVNLDENGRCPMLNENNLCRIVLKLGPEYLCTTCMGYPRSLRIFGNVIEGQLSMSCPEVIARLMKKPQVQFDLTNDERPTYPFSHTALYLFASSVRTCIVDLLQYPADVSLVTKLFASFDILNKAVISFKNGQTDFELFQEEIGQYFLEETLLALDNCLMQGINESSRYQFLLHVQSSLEERSGRFQELVCQVREYFAKNNADAFAEHIDKFKEAIAEYENFYINYWVYHIFLDAMIIPDYENVLERFIYTAAEFCLTQTIALVSFVNNGVLDKEEYIYIISNMSRMMEHNHLFREELTKRLDNFHAASAAGVLMMIIA